MFWADIFDLENKCLGRQKRCAQLLKLWKIVGIHFIVLCLMADSSNICTSLTSKEGVLLPISLVLKQQFCSFNMKHTKKRSYWKHPKICTGYAVVCSETSQAILEGDGRTQRHTVSHLLIAHLTPQRPWPVIVVTVACWGCLMWSRTVIMLLGKCFFMWETASQNAALQYNLQKRSSAWDYVHWWSSQYTHCHLPQ